MKKTKGKNFIIPLVVYPFDIMVSIGETDDQLKTSFGKYVDNFDFGNYFDIPNRKANCLMFEGGQTIIRFKEWQYTEMSTVSHEIFHAVTFIMNRIGMPLDEKNDEAWAYLIGYVTQEFYNRK